MKSGSVDHDGDDNDDDSAGGAAAGAEFTSMLTDVARLQLVAMVSDASLPVL